MVTWIKRRLNNGGNQHDLRIHLEARGKATGLTQQSPSLLGQILLQTESPQRCTQPRESEEVETDSESGWFGSEWEEEEMPESDDLASLVQVDKNLGGGGGDQLPLVTNPNGVLWQYRLGSWYQVASREAQQLRSFGLMAPHTAA
ncbi:hypothetical protein Purlil1_12617 [Purpureocillium lilacinum]|uniref:Uncharacterized protein n=1 Tax=Purpureocillium lilacinum TaxID=33203 RepID=A0ABR0BGE3_PURLI|nr:hypothetical protein Purlil1_12617 [Purpureocillium lilacinum]